MRSLKNQGIHILTKTHNTTALRLSSGSAKPCSSNFFATMAQTWREIRWKPGDFLLESLRRDWKIMEKSRCID